MIDDVVFSGLAVVGIQAVFRQVNSMGWDETLTRLDFIPVDYSQSEIDYQLVYLQGSGVVCQDISLILYHDNRPCGIWPLCHALHDGQAVLSSYLNRMLPPLFVSGLADKSKKSITKKCINLVELMCKKWRIEKWQSAESYIGEVGFSDWHEQSLQRGASASLRHELFVDLTLDMANIKAKFRKSYKSLIPEGMRIWKVGVLSEASPELWDSFRMLHLKVSGRATRTIETWDLQHQTIASGQAFLIYLHNVEGEMVGGGYFSVTRDQGAYNVGAYDRTLFAQPVGHVIQYLAIEEMKVRGLRWYKIGQRYYAQEDGVTEKQVTISEFMQGFNSHLLPKYILQHDG
jgi:FemAB family protein